MSLIDAKEVSIECPKCKRKQKQTIKSLKEKRVVDCVCGEAIKVDVHYLTRQMTKVDKVLERQRKDFERLKS